MPSVYLEGDDKTIYGVGSATDQQIEQSSSLIDGYLQRPEGLIWVPDANGNPCYMKAKSPSFTLTTTEDISPGDNVNVTVTGALLAISLGSSQCGLVAIMDRLNDEKREAVIVNGINGNTVQLTSVQFSHAAGSLLEFDLVIFEECQMPSGRPLTNVSKTPVRIVLAGQGRYGYPRRGNSFFEINEYNLLAAITKFGGPPIWEIFDQTLIGVDPGTGQLWAPAGILLAYYTEIRFSYIAGWTYASLPPSVKLACANIIGAMASIPMNGSIRSYRAGDTAIERFGSTYFSDDTKDLLQPFRARHYV